MRVARLILKRTKLPTPRVERIALMQIVEKTTKVITDQYISLYISTPFSRLNVSASQNDKIIDKESIIILIKRLIAWGTEKLYP